jgi:hypothetical protein
LGLDTLDGYQARYFFEIDRQVASYHR